MCSPNFSGSNPDRAASADDDKAAVAVYPIEIALGDPARESEALGGYESTRDELSHGLFEATDRIARYDWSLSEVQTLHRDFSRSMKGENNYVAQLPPHPAR